MAPNSPENVSEHDEEEYLEYEEEYVEDEGEGPENAIEEVLIVDEEHVIDAPEADDVKDALAVVVLDDLDANAIGCCFANVENGNDDFNGIENVSLHNESDENNSNDESIKTNDTASKKTLNVDNTANAGMIDSNTAALDNFSTAENDRGM